MPTKSQKGRRLRFGVHLHPTEDREAIFYEAGDIPPPEDADRITNSEAWEPEEVDDDEDGDAAVRSSSVARQELVKTAKGLGLSFGKDGLPKNASNETIAQAIRYAQGRVTGSAPAGSVPGYKGSLDDAATTSASRREDAPPVDSGNGAAA